MRPFTRHTGRMAPLDRANVDTDQIAPKQFCKRIERSGYGPFAFYNWRREEPDFVLDRPEHLGASVLVAGDNFGCGSSREHAVWALEDAGYRVVIAPSFGDIFRTNCHKTGLLPIALPEADVARLTALAAAAPAAVAEVDLEAQTVTAGGHRFRFDIEPFVKECLLHGWDDIGLTLRYEAEIARFELGRAGWMDPEEDRALARPRSRSGN